MTDQAATTRKRTPADASDFEREQLRFFLSEADVGATLSEINPSLAWLPILSELKLIQNDAQLIAWVERNFEDADAAREVVANIRFFKPETAGFLEYRLNHAKNLPPLLAKSWALIIRHMRTARQGLAQNEWHDIAPQLRRGERSAALLERTVNVLRPKLRIGKRLSWHDADEKRAPERPSDLMAIDYELDEHVSSDELLEAWPESATAETDARLLAQLNGALSTAVADAIDVGVESNLGYGISDTDVPSVARHRQNEYRSGFQVIVRVIAEIWTRLAKKSPKSAQAIAESWRDSEYRLLRRLALFAFADPAMPSYLGADMLATMPLAELFVANSSVETYRLIRARWNEFTEAPQARILARLREGPPRDLFKEGAEIDRHIDRQRYDVLSGMERDGLNIGPEAKSLLAEISTRWPQWQPKPAEQMGFGIWFESGTRHIEGEADKLVDVPDDDLVRKARELSAASDFMEGDDWQALCLNNPDKAMRGLAAATRKSDWPADLWGSLLWSTKAYSEADTESTIASLITHWPSDSFDKIIEAASWWLDQHSKTLPDDLLWPLWDRIADFSLTKSTEANHD